MEDTSPSSDPRRERKLLKKFFLAALLVIFLWRELNNGSTFGTIDVSVALAEHFQHMCGVQSDQMDWKKVKKVIASQDMHHAVVFGTEAWNGISLKELHNPSAEFNLRRFSSAFPYTVVACGKRCSEALQYWQQLWGVPPSNICSYSCPNNASLLYDHWWSGIGQDKTLQDFMNHDSPSLFASFNHFDIIEQLVNGSMAFDYVMVVEDDVIPAPDFDKKLQAILRDIDAHELTWDVSLCVCMPACLQRRAMGCHSGPFCLIHFIPLYDRRVRLYMLGPAWG